MPLANRVVNAHIGACLGLHVLTNNVASQKKNVIVQFGFSRIGICQVGLLGVYVRSHTPRYWVGGGSHPNFIQKLFFAYFCQLSVRALGHPNGLNPTVPRAPCKIPCWISAQNLLSSLFCRLSVPSRGRPFHHFQRQSCQCASKPCFVS